MLKFFGLILFTVSLSAQAQKCTVYGISDSPQKYFCQFPKGDKIDLRCVKGIYLLNDSPVDMAFHLEVETGASPLVFKSPKMTLTVTEENGIFKALVNSGNSVLHGACK